ncbi:MAG: hypothetical protein KatS3mg033_0064 [Thermonema sp.]|uniref:GEVED domain-containing protein n=1 Tax=Thermonema sp. TaxID=2231181 RepID=UPI0021DD3057|nr:GEVED domain-containing protein [Thermonema sp.]GIV38264.1 MAG: hypothetical protein KatS3mg033_0064 [Thermonema sp.]
MKKFFTLSLLMLLTTWGWAQHRVCYTDQVHERLLKEHPEMAQRMAEIERQTQRYVASFNQAEAATTVITIPVVVHVIYSNSNENISDAQIQSQIDVLNEDFRRLNADKVNTPAEFAPYAADVEIQFVLASTDPNGNPTNGITRKASSRTQWGTNDDMKYSSKGGVDAWPTDKYLNIWVCNIGGGILGYAQFPGGPAATDGVVISPQYFGRTGYVQAPFNKGRTTTHEVGHWLNLRHIWGDGNCSVDDFVSDTPTAGGPNYGCPSYPSKSCQNNGGWTSDQFMNYMDYVDDACMNMFSAGQKARMRALFAPGGARESFANGGGSTPPPASYCASKGNDASYEWIQTVKVGSFSYNSGQNGGYADFTTQTVNVAQGGSYAVTLTPGFSGSTYNEYWRIWIDFNDDKDFDDAGELVFSAGPSTSAVSGTLNIPSSAATGAKRMRVSMKYNAAPTACETFSYGEVEDYTINISTGGTTTCNTPAGLSASNVTASSFTLNWGAVSGAVSYDVRVRAQGTTSWTNFNGQSSTSLNVTGAAASTTYEWQVRTNCSGGSSAWSATQTVTTSAGTVTYCSSAGQNTSDEWIQRVRLGSIDNNSGNNGGYADFTSLSTNLAKGSSYTIYITPAWSGTKYREAYRVWIDFNQDGDFDDAGELVYSRARTTSTSISGSFTVPSSALTGATRMRVSMKYNAYPSPCETFTYGEVEDYTVNIVAAREAVAAHTVSGMEVNIYPNPAMHFATLSIAGGISGEAYTVRLMDMQGKVIEERTVTTAETTFDLSKTKAGIYLLQVIDNQGNQTIKRLSVQN